MVNHDHPSHVLWLFSILRSEGSRPLPSNQSLFFFPDHFLIWVEDQFNQRYTPDLTESSPIQYLSSFVMLIQWNCVFLPPRRFVPGAYSCRRRFLRLSTGVCPLTQGYGGFTWVFDPGIKFGRLSIVSLSRWGYQSGTRFKRWYSSFHQSWTLTITTNDVISSGWCHLQWKRCNRRSIAKFWKWITSYGEIVTEGVCRSTQEMSVDRHKSGIVATDAVGVSFFIDTGETETWIGLVVHVSPLALGVTIFIDVYDVKCTIGRAYPEATSLFYVMWSSNARMPERHTHHIRVRWMLKKEYIMFYNMIASKAYRKAACQFHFFNYVLFTIWLIILLM